MSWATEEFERLESIRWPASDAGDAYLKVKGARDLTRRELAIFRELVQWRDAAALKLDRATFRVVSNEVLFDAARVLPFSKLLRLMNEASNAVDNIHAEGASAPSKHIYGYTAWMQASFY